MCCQNFRDLVLEGSGPGMAAQLVAALVADQLEAGGGSAAGGVAELASALQHGAPAYFREQDRQFFQVSSGSNICCCGTAVVMVVWPA